MFSQESTPEHWTMRDVQERLHEILLKYPDMTPDHRRALKAVISMCDVWNRLSPGFQKVVAELREKAAK